MQKPYPPIVVGGRSEGALRRTVRFARGWYGYAMSVEQTREVMDALNATRARVERPTELGSIEITIAPREPVNAETIAAYQAIGVSRLLVRPGTDRPLSEAEAVIREHAPGR